MLEYLRKTTIALWMLSAAGLAHAAPLDIPQRDRFGQPIDVGVLVLGHSTSAVGDWPGKLAQSLNQTSSDGRNYNAFRAITGGDGGFLWTRLFIAPGDLQYDRVKASQAGVQWCEDTVTGNRYSARRAKLEWALRGQNPVPTTCSNNWAPPPAIACVWHENGSRYERNLPFHQCWQKMDVRVAMIQDTSNRSWPVDDYTRDGMVSAADYFDAEKIHHDAWSCPRQSVNQSGVVTTGSGRRWIDWNCDNRLDNADSAVFLYSQWLERLASDLLGRFGTGSVQHVFISPKPLEMVDAGGCERWFEGEGLCDGYSYSRSRTPTISRPFSYAYLPSVYWERVALEALFARNGLDTRIHRATADSREMWNRSAQCFEDGLLAGDWFAPSNTRPTVVDADLSESDSNASAQGCLLADHIHHNDNGGWMMSDVWYRGLMNFLNGS